jgi:hypothetical protein
MPSLPLGSLGMTETQQFSDLMDEYIAGMVLLKRGEGQIDPDKLAFGTAAFDSKPN